MADPKPQGVEPAGFPMLDRVALSVVLACRVIVCLAFGVVAFAFGVVAFLAAFVEEKKASGMVAGLIEKHGVVGRLSVAPAA